MNDSTTDGDGLARNDTSPTSPTAYPEYQAAETIWKICPAVLVVVGGFVNVATVCVMQRMKDGSSSQYAFFMALAVSDLTLLSVTAAHAWIHRVFRTTLQLLHPALCKGLVWAAYVSGSVSAWLVTCVTVQRTMAVLWPHRMRGMCTVRRTWIVVAVVVAVPCVMNVHLLVGLNLVYDDYDTVYCHAVEGVYRHFFDYVYHWIHGGLISVVPFVCQFICDIILSATLVKAVSSASIATRVESNSSRNTDSRKNVSHRTTVMVLVVSVTFLILTAPLFVFLNWIPYAYDELRLHPRKHAVVILLRALAFQLWYTNSVINFFLYCLTGTKFRREFITWVSCCGAKSSSARETAAEASKKGDQNHHGTSVLYR